MKFNTKDFSIANTKSISLEEKQRALYEMLASLSDRLLPSYQIEECSFISDNMDKHRFINRDEYLPKIARKISKLNSQAVDKHFNHICANVYEAYLSVYHLFLKNRYGKLPFYPHFSPTHCQYMSPIAYSTPQIEAYVCKEFESIHKIIFDYYGFMNDFQIRKPKYKTLDINSNKYIETVSMTYTSAKAVWHPLGQNIQIVEDIMGHCQNNDEAFQSLKKLPEALYNKFFVKDYVNNILLENQDNSEKIEFLNIKITRSLANELNKDSQILSRLNIFLDDNSFEIFKKTIPSLARFYNKFEFSDAAADEKEFSSITFYTLSKMGKDLGISQSHYSYPKYVIQQVAEKYSKLCDSNNFKVKIHETHIRQGQLSIIIIAEDEKSLEFHKKNIKDLINKNCFELFSQNITNALNLPFETVKNQIGPYVEKSMLELDLEINIPHKENNKSNTVKF